MPQARLRVRVTPRSSRNEAIRYEDGVLHVRVTAPPVEGAANRAVTDLVARLLGVPRSRVTVKSGASGREKTLLVDGVTDADLPALIRAALAAGNR